jgi:tetratricopeptide (TPR) repeat protein
MKTIAKAVLALACGVAMMMAQAKQPKPKSQKEVEALMAVQNAKTPDERIAAVEDLLAKFADTEYKPMVLQMAAATEQQKGDWEKMVVYSERTLQADPKNYAAMLMLADFYTTRTRENDLDKEEKLTRGEKYANDALEALKTAEKMRPDFSDEQWANIKKDLIAQAHAALGASAALRKKYDVAISEYKIAIDGSATPNPELMVRAAAVETDAGKADESIALLDKVMALPDVNPQTKQVAASEKARAQRVKTGAAKPATAPATVPQVEIKK